MKNRKKLTVTVNSFSFRRGIPYDASGNGGGYVFDCRGILNPGRYERYMLLSGKDTEVIDFFHKNTNIHQFLEHVYNLVKINIENYVEREFPHLMVNFGCTGGRHRSVYCAEWLAVKLRKQYNHLKTELNHKDLNE